MTRKLIFGRHTFLAAAIFSGIYLTGFRAMRRAETHTNAVPSENPEQHDARMQWWHDAKFGMFIHWGVYAIPARGEWVQWNDQIPVKEYAKLADQFHPANFNADVWAQTAKAAGMGYMVLTARHHDGFALFDDPGNPFTSVSTAAHKDFVAAYAKAVRKAGLHVGFYYSPLDWRFPGFFFPDLYIDNANLLREQYHRQMKELMSNYGKIDVLWFDGGESDWLSFGHDMSSADFPKRNSGEHYHGRFNWQGTEVNTMMRGLQPQIIVNNRAADVPPDFTSREGYVGDFDNEHPWETCSTLAGSWGYNGDKEPMSLKNAVQLLVNVVGRGGPFLPGKYGVSTYRGNKIYLHILEWPGDKCLLQAIPAKIISATAMTGGTVAYTQTGQGIEISMPAKDRGDMDTIIALEIDHSADSIQPVAVKTN